MNKAERSIVSSLCHCASPDSNLSKKKRKGKMADTAMFAAAEEVIDLRVHTFWADHAFLIKCIFSFSSLEREHLFCFQ